MTKKLEDLLNLPESKDIINQDDKQQKKPKKTHIPTETLEQLQEYDKIAAALPSVKGLGDIGDAELDEVSEKSMAAYDDLMDLGMNVEARFSGRIFEVAGQMLKVNLDSKVAKLDKKLKMVELQLKKEKLDKEANPEQNIIQGEGVLVTDRNSLLEKLKNMDK
jgi:uncharacterized protein involved in propanediol utilization